MPELPEVETMVRDLRRRLPGRSIVEARVYWDRTVGYPGVPAFLAALRNRQIESLERRGKFALIELDGGGTLAVHRGMTGSLFLRPTDFPEDRFVRARLILDDGSELRLDDSRKFGRLFLQDGTIDGWQAPWKRLGLEPLAAEFTTERLATTLTKRRVAIKTALLNQRIVAGIGNIYADESLFVAGIHPSRPAGSLVVKEIDRLRRAIVQVLSIAIDGRGTTFSSYRDIEGSVGGNQHKLQVFQRHGKECPRCGSPIHRIVLGARGTHFCSDCQK